jgi:hypothetical protein
MGQADQGPAQFMPEPLLFRLGFGLDYEAGANRESDNREHDEACDRILNDPKSKAKLHEYQWNIYRGPHFPTIVIPVCFSIFRHDSGRTTWQ